MSKVQVARVHSLTGHNDSIYTLQPSSAPGHFFSAAGDGMVVLWNLDDPENGQLIARLPNSIYGLHYHSKLDVLIAGHNYEGIHVLDWKNKKEIGSLQLTTSSIFDIQSTENFVLVGTGDGMMHAVDIENLQVLHQVFVSAKSIRAIALNPVTGDIAVGSSDYSIRIYDRSLIKKKEWIAHSNSVFTLRFTPDSKYLISGSRDARLKVWDVEKDYALAEEVVAHLYAINHLEFSPDGKHFVTCSMDKSIKVWNADTFRLLKVIDRSRHAGHGTSVNKLLWTSHHNLLLSASDDRTISVWQIIF
jgi:WD40 repeat protein